MKGKEIEGAFTEADISANAPESQGVYTIFEDEENRVLYVGSAASEDVTIKSCLLEHVAGKKGPCTLEGDGFRCIAMPADEALKAEKELLEKEKSENGAYPKCNASGTQN